jgi:hypothetical protein
VQEEALGVAADAAGRDAADEAEGRRWDDDRPNLLTLEAPLITRNVTFSSS